MPHHVPYVGVYACTAGQGSNRHQDCLTYSCHNHIAFVPLIRRGATRRHVAQSVVKEARAACQRLIYNALLQGCHPSKLPSPHSSAAPKEWSLSTVSLQRQPLSFDITSVEVLVLHTDLVTIRHQPTNLPSLADLSTASTHVSTCLHGSRVLSWSFTL